MKILIPVDTSPLINNSIIDEVSATITKANPSIQIDQNSALFWENISPGYDCIHFHWPEAIFGWKIPDQSDLIAFKARLRKWKKCSRIVITVHNLISHNSNPLNQKLYDIVYGCADTFIHMSNTSRQLLLERYNHIIPETAQHVVIPHGLYQIYDNSVSRTEARKKLGLAPDRFVILVFGRARSNAEEEVIKYMIDYFPDNNRKIIVPKWNFYKGNVPSLFRKRIDRKHYRFLNIFIPVHEVQYYFNASDIVFIQRMNNLNSGILILGFAFGKVLVGPNYGSMGEILRETGNPTYDPHNFASIIEAVQRGKELSGADKGAQNLEYARKNWNMELTAAKHIRVYKSMQERLSL